MIWLPLLMIVGAGIGVYIGAPSPDYMALWGAVGACLGALVFTAIKIGSPGMLDTVSSGFGDIPGGFGD